MRGKILWITGGGTGIGKALAFKAARNGAQVCISGRRADVLAETVQEAEAAGLTLSAYPLDVTDEAACLETVAKIESDFNRPVDIAVLNAGVSKFVPVEKFDLKIYRDVYEINVFGVLNCLNALLPDMIKRKSGHVATVASVAGYRGLPNASAYCMSKAALINMAEALRPELSRYNVKMQTVCPGFVKTPLTDKNTFPMPFLISPEDAAEKFYNGLLSGKSEINFPAFFCFLMKLYRILPNFIVDYCGGKILKR